MIKNIQIFPPADRAVRARPGIIRPDGFYTKRELAAMLRLTGSQFVKLTEQWNITPHTLKSKELFLGADILRAANIGMEIPA